MFNDSFAPIKRASLFFGVMGIAIASLTLGAGLQIPTDESSATVAQAKMQRNEPTDSRIAAVNPRQQQASPAKRAIATAQQAMVAASPAGILR
jgi:hypothetical protein